MGLRDTNAVFLKKKSRIVHDPTTLFYYLFIYLFMAAFGLHCCSRASSSCSEGGYSSLWCVGVSLRWLLLLGAQALGAWASVVVTHRLSSCGSQALERRLSSYGARA